ncbi:MAG: hypothetical protein K0S33_3791 [Bacteroidetes bacterium]|jgi:hypothetical protein|nr:hypothetical protein [Bacteroidota bacterium]
MKKRIETTFLIFALSLLVLNAKAQDDPIVGFYVDGVKVTEINCYTFGSLKLVLPFDPAYASYDRFVITVYNSESFQMGNHEGAYNVLSKPKTLSMVKNNYFVYEVLKKGEKYGPAGNDSDDPNAYSGLTNSISRATVAFYAGKKHGPECDLIAYLFGETIESYREEVTTDNRLRKIPVYKAEDLGPKIKLHCTNRTQCGKWATEFQLNKDMDLSQPCTVSGTPVDFNNLGKSGATTNVTNSAPLKNETPANTPASKSKIVFTTIAPTSAAAVKPLDKTKPGYFEEKSDDKKFMYRNGYQLSPGVYHGEVREYEANQLEKIITYTNGVEDGLYVVFSDGKIEWSGNYKNGKKDGTWKHYKNGVLEETEKYVDGTKQ